MNHRHVSTPPPPKARPSPFRDTLGLLAQAGKVGNRWHTRLGRLDRRREQVQAMNSLIAESLAASDNSPKTIDAVRLMLCDNCSKLHPGLATLCDLQPEVSGEKLDRCWLIKGSRCRISRQWKIFPGSFSLII
jgi:hypothetical protein